MVYLVYSIGCAFNVFRNSICNPKGVDHFFGHAPTFSKVPVYTGVICAISHRVYIIYIIIIDIIILHVLPMGFSEPKVSGKWSDRIVDCLYDLPGWDFSMIVEAFCSPFLHVVYEGRMISMHALWISMWWVWSCPFIRSRTKPDNSLLTSLELMVEEIYWWSYTALTTPI